MADDSIRYILFLNLEKKLPEYFFNLSTHFAVYGISLVPIGPEELKKMSVTLAPPIIAVTSSFSTLRNFRSIRRSILDVAVNNKKYMLFHLSSFSNSDSDFTNARRWGYYYNYRLPIKMEQLVESISGISDVYWNRLNRWPGGTRVPLDKSISVGA